MKERIEEILRKEGIEFATDDEYINILNSSSATRVHIFNYKCDGTIYGAAIVQEFDEFGNQTYSKEFATIGKAFLNRIKRNLG